MKRAAALMSILALCLSLASCSTPSSGGDASEVISVQSGEDGVYSGPIEIVENQASNITVFQQDGSTIDASNSRLGYVMVAQSGVEQRLKVQIIKDDVKYNYDLNNDGTFEAYPLQLGDGSYTVRITQNKEGNSYFELFSAVIDVKLDSEFSPFLCPNQYVNYNGQSDAVKKSMDLCYYAESDIEKLAVVYQWIIEHVDYDMQKAETVQSGYLPVVDEILTEKKGICFDYAALLATMLRAQGIPTKLVVGTVSEDDLNHAWNEVYLKNMGWVTVKLKFEGNQWELADPTLDASSGNEFSKYIGNGDFYTSLRFY